MQIGQVGQPYEHGQDKLEEKILYRLDKDGHCLMIAKAGITAQEAEDTEQGRAELGVYIDGPVLFLLFKFGSGNWNDAAYSWHTVPRDVRVYPEQAEAAGLLRVSLVEAGNGIVRAVREIALAPDFAEKLNAAITTQANGSFNGLSYAKHLNMVYNQYSSEEMVEMAGMRMVAHA